MSLLLLILIFLFKNIEAGREGCNSYPDNSKIYECNDCTPGYNKMHPQYNCVICFKCEITYCNECSGNVCSKCLDGFYLNNNKECKFVIPIAKLALGQRLIVTVVMMDIMCPMENANHVTQNVIDALAQQQIAKVAKMDFICPMDNAEHVAQIV